MTLIGLSAFAALAAGPPPSPVPIPPPPHQLRLVWQGTDLSELYEIQGASDPRFTQNLGKMAVRLQPTPLPTNRLPPYARIRPVQDGKALGEWLRLRTRPWPAPHLAAQFRLKAGRVKDTPLSWRAPPGTPPKSTLSYRARIFQPNGQALLDSIVRMPSLKLPGLPPGAYELQVETLGDPEEGCLHIEGTGASAAVILVE